MELGLNGKVALLSGAVSPIGNAVAGALRAAGAIVIARRTAGREPVAGPGRAAAQALIERIVDRCGRLDIVIHDGFTPVPAAGAPAASGASGPAEDELDRAYRDCVKTAFHIAHAAAVQYRQARRGVIVNIAPDEVADPARAPWQSACAAALGQLSQTLAQQLREDGIRVNAIRPMRGAGDVRDGAALAVRTALFLASDASRDISGLVFPVEMRAGHD